MLHYCIADERPLIRNLVDFPKACEKLLAVVQALLRAHACVGERGHDVYMAWYDMVHRTKSHFAIGRVRLRPAMVLPCQPMMRQTAV